MSPLNAKTVSDAYGLASRVLSLALGCVVPTVLGYFLDEWQSIRPIGVLIGSLVGFLSLFVQLRQLVREMTSKLPEHKKPR